MSEVAAIIVPVVVAFIMAGIPAIVAFQRLRKENTDQHAASFNVLENLDKTVNRVETKIDKHLGWHDGQENSTPN